jgi:hypothetical protein
MKNKDNPIKFIINLLKYYQERVLEYFRLSFFYYYITRNMLSLILWLVNVELACTIQKKLLIQLLIFIIVLIIVIIMAKELLSDNLFTGFAKTIGTRNL